MYFYNVRICLNMLFLVGIHPEKGQSKIQHFLCAITVLASVSIIYLSVLLLVYKEGNITITELTDTFSSCSMLLHGLLRISTLYKNRYKIQHLLSEMKKYFWNVQDVENETTKLLCYKLLNNTRTIFHLFALMCISTATIFSVGTFFAEDNNLPFPCYIPEWAHFYQLHLYQTIVNIFSVNIPIVGMDVLLFTFISLTHVQFVMLNDRIVRIFDAVEQTQLQYETLRKSLKKIVDHHNFLLYYTNCINDCFSMSLLGYMLIIVSSMCVEMYNLSTKSSSMEVFVKAAIYVAAALFQFVMCYCLPSQRLTDEAEKIPNKIYLSKWAETEDSSLDIILIIANGQRRIQITAGGMINMDLATSLSTIKTMVSYCMFLNTVGSK